jgi:hypothetical protein
MHRLSRNPHLLNSQVHNLCIQFCPYRLIKWKVGLEIRLLAQVKYDTLSLFSRNPHMLKNFLKYNSNIEIYETDKSLLAH